MAYSTIVTRDCVEEWGVPVSILLLKKLKFYLFFILLYGFSPNENENKKVIGISFKKNFMEKMKKYLQKTLSF